MSPEPSPSNGAERTRGGRGLLSESPRPTAGRNRSAPEFSIAIGRAEGTVVVTIHGEIDTSGARHLEQILHDLIENQENLRVVVDLRDVAQLDAVGVTALLVAANRAHQHGATFAVSQPSEMVYESREGTGMAEIVPISRRPRAGRPPATGPAQPPHLPAMAFHPSSEPGPSIQRATPSSS